MGKYDSYIIQKILFFKAPMERRLHNNTIILDYAPQS